MEPDRSRALEKYRRDAADSDRGLALAERLRHGHGPGPAAGRLRGWAWSRVTLYLTWVAAPA